MLRLAAVAFLMLLALGLGLSHAQPPDFQGDLACDPLPSWNAGPTKQRLMEFICRTTTPGCPEYVQPSERIATFDNDGTLWVEHPMYTQVVFALDRVKALAPQHPEWKEKQPFKAVLEGDMKTLAAAGEKGLFEIIAATHADMSVPEFEKIAGDWLATARQPRFNRLYTECVYQPMLELLAFLRCRGYKTFIVSGGTIDFMRPFTERVYGIPPEQVVGSGFKIKYEVRDGKPVLWRLPDLTFVDDHAGKPVGIESHIGRRPILAFGNSDGDFEMLEYTTSGPGPRLGLIVHHTDAEREYAYDRDTHVGRLDKALTEAPKRGWVVVDMKNDWRTIFPPQRQ